MQVKICGLTRAEDVAAAVEAGADLLGFCFYDPSPRAVDPNTARALVAAVPSGVTTVALVVDPDDALVAAVAGLGVDMIQLHGHETPQRASSIRAATGLPIMKVIGVRTAADLDAVGSYAGHVDRLLVDAKPPPGAALPGGNGLSFDWSLLVGRTWPMPWMLAGGLTPDNVADAVARTGAPGLDVASGVESAPGIKDPDRIRSFIANARSMA